MTIPAGDNIVLAGQLAWDDSSAATVASVSQAGGTNPWTLGVHVENISRDVFAAIWYRVYGTWGTTTVITVHIAGSSFFDNSTFMLSAYEEAFGTPFTNISTGVGSFVNTVTANISVPSDNSIILTALSLGDDRNVTPDGSQTTVHSFDSGAESQHFFRQVIATAVSTVTQHWSTVSGENYAVASLVIGGASEIMVTEVNTLSEVITVSEVQSIGITEVFTQTETIGVLEIENINVSEPLTQSESVSVLGDASVNEPFMQMESISKTILDLIQDIDIYNPTTWVEIED